MLSPHLSLASSAHEFKTAGHASGWIKDGSRKGSGGGRKAAIIRMAAGKGVAYGKGSEGVAVTAVCRALKQVTFIITLNHVYSKAVSNRCVLFMF